MQPQTHLAISEALCGTPIALQPGEAIVELVARPEMAADAQGLVHGGFVFGLADYAAMLAINQPNVVLGSAELRLSAPVAVGERLRASARLLRVDGKKHIVDVDVTRGAESVLRGSFVCFVPAEHVLARRAESAR